MKSIFKLVLIILIFQSCANYSKMGNSKYCELHKITMKKSIVRTSYGRADVQGNKKEYINAKTKKTSRM